MATSAISNSIILFTKIFNHILNIANGDVEYMVTSASNLAIRVKW